MIALEEQIIAAALHRLAGQLHLELRRLNLAGGPVEERVHFGAGLIEPWVNRRGNDQCVCHLPQSAPVITACLPFFRRHLHRFLHTYSQGLAILVQFISQAGHKVNIIGARAGHAVNAPIVNNDARVAVLHYRADNRGDLIVFLTRIQKQVVNQVSAHCGVFYIGDNRKRHAGGVCWGDAFERAIAAQLQAGFCFIVDDSIFGTIGQQSQIERCRRHAARVLHHHEIGERVVNLRFDDIFAGQDGIGHMHPALPVPAIHAKRFVGKAVVWDRDAQACQEGCFALNLQLVQRAFGDKMVRQVARGFVKLLPRQTIEKFHARNAAQGCKKASIYPFIWKTDNGAVCLGHGAARCWDARVGKSLKAI